VVEEVVEEEEAAEVEEAVVEAEEAVVVAVSVLGLPSVGTQARRRSKRR